MKSTENLPDYVMRCAQLAAILEASGYPKPGNVHRTADFDDLRFEDFLSSAIALGPPIRRLARRGLAASKAQLPLRRIRIGEAVKEAVEQSTSWQKGGNTHLGTILLFIPLVAGAGLCGSIEEMNPARLRLETGRVVGATTTEDAANAFEAIAKTTPHSLGKLSDASAPDLSKKSAAKYVQTTLLEAMRHSARWDGVASEWSTCFERVFVVSLPEFIEVFAHTRDVNIATVHTFLFLLSHFPDTFIARKVGLRRTPYIEDAVKIGIEETYWIRGLAAKTLKLGGLTTLDGKASILELDNRLRSEGGDLNPGTTADLTGATLLVSLLCGWRF